MKRWLPAWKWYETTLCEGDGEFSGPCVELRWGAFVILISLMRREREISDAR